MFIEMQHNQLVKNQKKIKKNLMKKKKEKKKYHFSMNLQIIFLNKKK